MRDNELSNSFNFIRVKNVILWRYSPDDYVCIESDGVLATTSENLICDIKLFLEDSEIDYDIEENTYTGLALFKIS